MFKEIESFSARDKQAEQQGVVRATQRKEARQSKRVSYKVAFPALLLTAKAIGPLE